MIPSVKKGTAVGLVAVGIATGAAVFKTTYIDADGGGDIVAYTQQYDKLYRENVHVVVRGNCYSSCTMALGYPNTCLGPNAVLGFHPGYVPYLWGFLHYAISPQGTQIMRDRYPPDALAVIDKYRGLEDKGGWFRPEITAIKGSEFPRRYQCAIT